MKLTRKGDIVTALETGVLRMTYGQGRRADEVHVGEGEVIEITESTKLAGVEVLVFKARPDRVQLQRTPRMQTQRYCDLSFASMEMPPMVNPLIRDIEAKLEERGALLKRRMAQESQRLREAVERVVD